MISFSLCLAVIAAVVSTIALRVTLKGNQRAEEAIKGAHIRERALLALLKDSSTDLCPRCAGLIASVLEKWVPPRAPHKS